MKVKAFTQIDMVHLEVVNLRSLFILVCAAFLTCMSLGSAGNFRVDMDVNAYVDAARPNSSFAENETIWATSTGGTPAKEAYFSFLNNFVTAAVSKSDMIKSATMSLNANNVEKPGKVKAYFVHGPTLETTNWNNKPDYDGSVFSELNIGTPGEYDIDVTPLIRKAVEACPGECGYSIVLIAEGDASIGFASKNTSDKPSLEYTTSE